MGVYKRGRIYWYEFWHQGIRHRESTGCTSKREAEDIEREARRAARLGTSAQTRITIDDAATAWFTDHARHLKSWRTIAFQLRVCRRVLDFSKDMADLSTADIAAAIAARRAEQTHNKRPPTNATINREIIDVMRPVHGYARRVRGALVQEIDWRSVRLKERKNRVREFTPDEQAAVVAQLLDHHRLILAFFARYGARMSEAWFPLSAFNAESGRIWLRDRKDGGDHVIRLIESDRQMMAERAKRAKAAGLDTVWFRENREGGLVAIPPATFQTAMKRAYTRAGITNARAVHDWRHHAATAFVRATGDLRAAQHLLGHSQIAMTGRYAHPEERAVTDALEAMAAAATPHKITHSEGEGAEAGDDGEPGQG